MDIVRVDAMRDPDQILKFLDDPEELLEFLGASEEGEVVIVRRKTRLAAAVLEVAAREMRRARQDAMAHWVALLEASAEAPPEDQDDEGKDLAWENVLAEAASLTGDWTDEVESVPLS